MAKLSITQAAKMAGISRQTLYVKYINTGKISVEVVNDKKSIDTSEIIRIFNDVKLLDVLDGKELQHITPENTSHDKDKIIALLESQLIKAEEREERLNIQVTELLQQQTRLLEDKTSKPRKKFLGIF
jgi:predicted transcriptional regulator